MGTIFRRGAIEQRMVVSLVASIDVSTISVAPSFIASCVVFNPKNGNRR